MYWFDVLGADGGDYAAPGTMVTKGCSITVDAAIAYLPITDAVSQAIGGANDPGGRSMLEQRTLKELKREALGVYNDHVSIQLKMP